MVTNLHRGLLAAIFSLGTAILFYGASNFPPLTRAASDSSCQLTWSQVTAPQVGKDRLNDVHALAANDVWAVGDTDSIFTLTEHWNGAEWSVIPSPNASGTANVLKGVDGVSPNDVWAVGTTMLAVDKSQALILRWDGGAWNIIPGPALEAPHNLEKVAVFASNDVWAVGAMTENGIQKNLALHWDGVTWQVVPTPNSHATFNALYNVAAVSPNDVWAVGTSILHWDGAQWSMSYIDPAGIGFFQGLVAFAPNDIWTSSDKFLHWNGTQWDIVPPGYSLTPGVFGALDGSAPDDMYAVGSVWAHGSLGISQHFDGEQWNEIVTPAWERNTYLYDVSIVSAAEVWAVGVYNKLLPPPLQHSIIMHGAAPCIVPTPSPTPTPVPLKTPLLLSPPNQSTVLILRPSLDWRNVKNATHYRVQLRKKFGAWKHIATVNASEYKSPKLEHGTYMWRVRACDATRCGAWSNYFAFTVK